MAGWIVSITTVTHSKPYGRPIERTVLQRRAGAYAAALVAPVWAGFRKGEPDWVEGAAIAGPCGSPIPEVAVSAFARTVDSLLDYAARWGANPLGDGIRLQGAQRYRTDAS